MDRVRHFLSICTLFLTALIPAAYAQDQIAPRIVLQTGHTQPVLRIEPSPDGRFLISFADDESFLWDATSGVLLRRLSSHRVPGLFSPDSRLLLSRGIDGSPEVSDAATGAITDRFEPPLSLITAVVWLNDGRRFLTGHADGAIFSWELGRTKATLLFKAAGAPITTIRVSPDGNWIAVLQSPRKKLLADCMNGAGCPHIYQILRTLMRRPKLSERSLSVWPTNANGPVKPVREWNGIYENVQFKPNSLELIAYRLEIGIGRDELPASKGMLDTLSIKAAKPLKTWAAPSIDRPSLEISLSGKSLSLSGPVFEPDTFPRFGAARFQLNVFDTISGLPLSGRLGNLPGIVSANFSPGANYIYLAHHDGFIEMSDAKGEHQMWYGKDIDYGSKVGISDDGNAFFVGGDANESSTRCLSVTEPVGRIPGTLRLRRPSQHNDRISGSYTKSGNWLLDATANGAHLSLDVTDNGGNRTVRLRIVDPAKPAATEVVVPGGVCLGALSEDAATAVVVSSENFIGGWPQDCAVSVIENGSIRTVWKEANRCAITSVAVSASARRIAVADQRDGTVTVLAYSQDRTLWVKRNPAWRTGAKLEFDSSGKRLLVAGPLGASILGPDRGSKIVELGSQLPTPASSDATDFARLLIAEAKKDPQLFLTTAAAWIPDSDQVVSGSGDGQIVVWDASTGMELKRWKSDGGSISSIAAASRGKGIVTGHTDGGKRIWGASNRQLSGTLLVDIDGNWAFLTPAGFFQSSGNVVGRDLLQLVRGTEVLSLEQFRDQLERPDLVNAALSSNDLERAAYEKAAAELNLEAILQSGSPPKLEYVKHEPVPGGVRITVRLSNSSNGGIGTELKWRVDGVLQGNPTPDELSKPEARLGPVEVTQTLQIDTAKKSDLEITVTAYNGRNLLATAPLPIPVSRGEVLPPRERRARMYIIGIGVDKYTDPKLKPLELAVSDVTVLADEMSKTAHSGGYDVQAPVLLRNEDAQKGRVVEEFAKLAASDIQAQDALVVLLAGHGISDGECYYYLPFGVSFSNGEGREEQGISCKLWESLIAKVQVDKKAIFIDTCESANATSIIRGGDDVSRQSTFERIHRSSGYAVFTAARDAAREYNQLGHGLLTYVVRNALGRPGVGPDKVVDMNSIKLAIETEVPALSQQEYLRSQIPSVKVVNNFPLGPARVEAGTPQRAKCELQRWRVVGREAIVLREEPKPDARIKSSRLGPRGSFQVCERVGGFAKIVDGRNFVGWAAEDEITED